LTVKSLTVGGAPKPAGTHNAHADKWIEGKGKVIVRPWWSASRSERAKLDFHSEAGWKAPPPAEHPSLSSSVCDWSDPHHGRGV